MTKRTHTVFTTLAVLWVLLVLWQFQEHRNVRARERVELINRARAVTTTLGSEMWLIRVFNTGWIWRDRLQPLLNDVVDKHELLAVAVVNKDGKEVISAGPPIDFEALDKSGLSEHWKNRTVTLFANVVDLVRTNITGSQWTNANFIVSREEWAAMDTNRPTAGGDGPPGFRPPPPGLLPREDRGPDRIESAHGTNAPASTNLFADGSRPPPDRGRRGGFGRRPMRPPGMSEEQFRVLTQEKGAHSFVVVMSTRSLEEACNRDLLVRAVVCLLGAVAAFGSGIGWRNQLVSGELEVRLVRASELNARLKEMNLAAAGLAHETRNPLNIIRGLAQMISKQQDASPEVRSKTREILDEADRVTAQLNEFINYSRPREVRRTAVPVGSVVGEVVRALNYDIEEKVLRVEVQPNLPTISADEQLLRQALFNLLLNATQAVERGGEIHVSAQKVNGNEVMLEIRDNGPGVPPEQRKEIFKPYFTTNQKGTGLGLAVVQQIVLAHGWDVECNGNEPRGAVFQISHIKLAPATSMGTTAGGTK